MWLLKLIERITDLIDTIQIIDDIRRKDWRALFGPLPLTACLVIACVLLHISPVLGAIVFIGIIAFGFAFWIHRLLSDEKKNKRSAEKPSPQGEALTQVEE